MTGTPAKIRAILERVSDALSQTEIDLRSYIKEHPDFKEVGERMLRGMGKGPTTLTSSRSRCEPTTLRLTAGLHLVSERNHDASALLFSVNLAGEQSSFFRVRIDGQVGQEFV